MPADRLASTTGNMNVLLTCAGRRGYLVHYFREALGGRGRVLAADSVASAPAMQLADESFLIPPLTDPAYIDQLFDLCRQCGVRLLIPLHDRELPLLAAHRGRFLAAGILPLVSSPEVIATCFDKWATVCFLEQHGFDAVKTYRSLPDAQAALASGHLSFPLAIKPRYGSASIGIDYVESDQELALASALAQLRQERPLSTDQPPAALIQEFLSGTEYGLDIIHDLEGNHITTVVKRKLGMRAGETDRATTERHPRLEQLGARLGRALQHIGNLDCDVIVTATGCYVIDLNPRFGGGYPFSHAAGIHLPAALLAWACGAPADPGWFRAAPDIQTAKYDTLAIIERAPASHVSAAPVVDKIELVIVDSGKSGDVLAASSATP